MKFFLLTVLFLSWITFGFTQASFPLSAVAYDSHTELKWIAPTGTPPTQYRIFKAENNGPFQVLITQTTKEKLDFVGPITSNFKYYVAALNGIGATIALSDTQTVAIAPQSDEALLDMVQEYTLRYFFEFGHPSSGMARERNTSEDIVTSGGTGFGIMALLAGVERGFITRQQALDRLLLITGFLGFADTYHGAFPHWINGNTGNVAPFSPTDNGGDLVETAFLMQGLLCARQYFNLDDPLEMGLRESITNLYEAVEWDWYRKNNSNVLYWHWSPNFNWQINFALHGFNETMIVYMLAIASPTHPVPASLWNTGWTSQNYESGLTWYNQLLAVGPPLGGPLFFSHYSFLGFDPRNKKDAFCNYFQRNKAHTLINRSFCIDNPLNHVGYSEQCWGLTASDDPFGYSAHEALGNKDNGTITPTAALGSMPYTPTESMAALKDFYRNKGEKLWGKMGFFDAFNETQNWWADSYLAIDQGPIVVMIENYRSGLLWNLFMANPEIQPMLDSIGFVEDLTPDDDKTLNISQLQPNPATNMVQIVTSFPISDFDVEVTDVAGRSCYKGKNLQFSVALWPTGQYFVRLRQEQNIQTYSLWVN